MLRRRYIALDNSEKDQLEFPQIPKKSELRKLLEEFVKINENFNESKDIKHEIRDSIFKIFPKEKKSVSWIENGYKITFRPNFETKQIKISLQKEKTID